ncbi:MAG: alanine:cation symporter family protein [Bacteroidales bacterium]|nr:alanine:cation symporter family protein [Bacteroidales bacterium]
MISILDKINEYLWSYILVALLIICALYFTFRSRGVQFRLFGRMCRLLFGGGDKDDDKDTEKKKISSFRAFSVSLASRVGTGNMAGVASAIVVGGPGAVFWMWMIALFGAATSFVESTLAQVYKRRGKDSFIGGPAYYMKHGLGKGWLGVVFAVLITLTFGISYNMLQSNTICAAMENAFDVPPVVSGIFLAILTFVIIFGGIHRISGISQIIVPIMALGYLLLAIVVIGMNITKIPDIFALIFRSAFGWEQAVGGGIGAAVMQGFKRGLFSNEAGEGSAPNAAATADIDHPASQGLVQALGVFVDTLVVCSCTAFIILASGAPLDGTLDGINLTQAALQNEVGGGAVIYVTLAIFFFAFSSVLGNTYYGETNIRFFSQKKLPMVIYRLSVCAIVLLGAFVSLDTAWVFVDIMMALLTLCNLAAIIPLSKISFKVLDDYCSQLKKGIESPVFHKNILSEKERKGISEWE